MHDRGIAEICRVERILVFHYHHKNIIHKHEPPWVVSWANDWIFSNIIILYGIYAKHNKNYLLFGRSLPNT